ncbi:LexA family transcriptional regulator [Thalassospira povalilytica]|uniref:LexA family transcriptional regulator n=1 Tax=Thalassospira povalilytica TaxID=732237 RepID=UPI003AA9672E
MKSDRFQENLKKLMGDDSKASFAHKCGFSVGALTNYLNGSIPGADKALRIAEVFGVNVQWLVTGEGPMSVSDQKASPPGNAAHLPMDSSGFAPVPVFDVHASAGNGAMNFGEVVSGYLSLPVSYLKDQLHVDPKDACGIYINGDSMEPALEDGGVALLDRSENARSNKGDGIYTFRIGEELYIKRLERQGSRIVVHSDNPAYNPWEISDHDKANMKILARVVGTFRNL